MYFFFLRKKDNACANFSYRNIRIPLTAILNVSITYLAFHIHPGSLHVWIPAWGFIQFGLRLLADVLKSKTPVIDALICFFSQWVLRTCWSYVISLARRENCPFCCFIADLWWCRIIMSGSVLTKECSIECTQNQEVFGQDYGCVLQETHIICRLP